MQGIINTSNVTKNDLVIEIGPGLGNLTEYILDNAKYVLAIEIDKNMIKILEDRFKNRNNLKIINEDILKININNLIDELKEKNNLEFESVKVIANLPYYITTPIIFKLLENDNYIYDITVMVQKEVADRMVASIKSKDYGILTLMVNYYSTPNISLIVPNSSFIPSPEVTSAVIKLSKEKKFAVKNEKLFFDLIHCSFAKRRKKMLNSLEMSNFWGYDKNKLKEIFNACDIDENARAEELDINKFINIADYIYKVKNN